MSGERPLNTSDTNLHSAAQTPLPLASWHPGEALTDVEEEMRTKARTGEPVGRGEGPFELADMQGWGMERAIRGAVLRYLLAADDWPVEEGGVQLRGVRISGRLDLEGVTLRCALRLGDCYLDAGEPVCLDHATAHRLTLARCHLAGLTGEMLSAREVDLSGSTLTGPVWVLGAEITGQLICHGAKLTSPDNDGNALVGAYMKAGAGVFLNREFTAAGAIRLSGANLTGPLNCSGAKLTGKDNDGYALVADGMKVSGGVFLGQEFTAAGAVRLSGADITGQLDCGGAKLTGKDNDADALIAERIKVGGGVFLGREFTAAGAVRLSGADITGQLNCRGAKLTSKNNQGNALVADGVKVRGGVFLGQEFTAAGAISLSGADITGPLDCGGAKLTGKDNNEYALIAERMKAGGDVFLDQEFTAAGTISLSGADITGQLNCRGAKLTSKDNDGYALVADGVKVGGGVFLNQEFTAAGAVSLSDADITGPLNCSGAKLTGKDNDGYALVAERMKVRGGVFLGQEFTASGAVRLSGADLTGQLDCGGAKLTGKDNQGNALSADGVKVGGGVFLDQEFTASGAVRLSGADITGPLNCRGATLTGQDNNGNALVGDGVKVEGDTVLGQHVNAAGEITPVTAAGAIRLVGADVTGQLSCRGAKLTGKNNQGDALSADGMKVGGDVLLDQEFTAAGAIRLRSARIGGSVALRPATLAGSGMLALNAATAQITGELVWEPDWPVSGQVNLEGAAVGHLVDDWREDRPGGFWPTEGLLRLDGFTYDRFGGDHQATVDQRLDWIRGQYQRSGKSYLGVVRQPYEQLAKVYRQAGRDGSARKVAIARRADLRRYGNLPWYRWAGNWFMDKTIKFGYQTWRAALGLAVVFVAFLVMTFVAQQHHAIVPVSDLVAGVHPAPVATRCAPSYPCFYPFGYAVDVVIPVINVHQADFWGLNGWGWVAGSWAATGLGWSAVTLLAVGYTSLVRQQ
jgi:hypothetical protein